MTAIKTIRIESIDVLRGLVMLLLHLTIQEIIFTTVPFY